MSKSKVKKVGAYKRGLYQSALAFIRTNQVVTRAKVVKFYVDAGKSETASLASATVLLSPRKEDSTRGKKGNCLGNFSADGVHYYMIPLAHKKGEEKKFRFHLCTPEEVTARTVIDNERGNGRKVVVKVVKAKKVKAVKVVNAVKVSKKSKVKKVKVVKVVKVVKEVVAVTAPVTTVETPTPVVVPESVVVEIPSTPAV
jgi:hypothetical protein